MDDFLKRTLVAAISCHGFNDAELRKFPHMIIIDGPEVKPEHLEHLKECIRTNKFDSVLFISASDPEGSLRHLVALLSQQERRMPMLMAAVPEISFDGISQHLARRKRMMPLLIADPEYLPLPEIEIMQQFRKRLINLKEYELQAKLSTREHREACRCDNRPGLYRNPCLKGKNQKSFGKTHYRANRP